ncbi:MAG: DUF3224 domain-containing protein [Caldilineaceae bacterium]|nr:DUF3224 domain-containing protein [Caldilineaceae bacterium]
MTQQAKGTFEIDLKPLSEPNSVDGATLGRMSINKQFHGDLTGTGKGEMLSAMTAVEGSAGYVAIEHVSGSLHGRTGSFVFQHVGIMNRGEQQLTITVVPDSGAGELVGISGSFTIDIVDGQHQYIFTYSLGA